MTGLDRKLSQGRIDALVKAVRAETHMSVSEIKTSLLRPAVRARHGIWRELRGLGFGYTAIARAWGCDHTTVHNAINGKPYTRDIAA